MPSPYTQLYVHLVWSTWDRMPAITVEIATRIYAALNAKCEEFKCRALAIGGVEDHVHMLVCLHPMVSVSRLVGELKGSSAHLVNHAIVPGGSFHWQGSYGAFSIAKRAVPRVNDYILNQAGRYLAGGRTV